ncbi:DDE-type integrase/transposase/recombinase [Soehngenia longivitae]|uniref:DDE-type integrase/transposase/recombinase n=1 Tax=Soehngenia longivitae TaxID=2562294 RepID=UPI001ADEB36D|nr:DDE-type integrase/transposase/recombinase [Soehngenia longivitae]
MDGHILPLSSRKIIGYAYGTSMTAGLTIKAVENACLNVVSTEGIILHSDLGSQYTGNEFESFLASNGISTFF